MLLAVEGGGFFSSSASGYSKGLALIFLGQKNEDKPMRVSPWNQYQLVDQESDPDLQLASAKNRLARGCASFVCFGRTSAGLDTSSPLKVGPAQQQDVLPGSLASDKSKDNTADPEDNNNDASKVSLKSSLKKPSNTTTQASSESGNEFVRLGEAGSDIPDHTERRKVQWTDACGSELAQINEFEPRWQEMNKVRSKVGTDEAEETRSIRLKLEQNREYLRETYENKNKEKWRAKWISQTTNLTTGLKEVVHVQSCSLNFTRDYLASALR